ncbi:hypothetical protein B0J11DRAFT_576035 [Dendryphion nanum]|uniref:Uncharacterized protein n=1 Tax=Dendryphion nanum TaxID=256645 RepID=A0A9P9EE27_9PLEO|nr:hypothetical protein B0J11DRAFT_576035 [Dendryphion nanum]
MDNHCGQEIGRPNVSINLLFVYGASFRKDKLKIEEKLANCYKKLDILKESIRKANSVAEVEAIEIQIFEIFKTIRATLTTWRNCLRRFTPENIRAYIQRLLEDSHQSATPEQIEYAAKSEHRDLSDKYKGFKELPQLKDYVQRAEQRKKEMRRDELSSGCLSPGYSYLDDQNEVDQDQGDSDGEHQDEGDPEQGDPDQGDRNERDPSEEDQNEEVQGEREQDEQKMDRPVPEVEQP